MIPSSSPGSSVFLPLFGAVLLLLAHSPAFAFAPHPPPPSIARGGTTTASRRLPSCWGGASATTTSHVVRLRMSSEDGDDPNDEKLLFGEEASASLSDLESKLQDLGTEEGYLAAARARAAGEAKAKAMAEYEEEERLAAERDAAAQQGDGGGGGGGPSQPNYGPGDLSEAVASGVLTLDDGWENSLGRDDDNIIGAQALIGTMGGEEDEGGDDEEEPTLFIPSGDDGDGPIVF